MNTALRRFAGTAAWVLPAGVSAEFLGRRAFDRRVRRDVQSLFARASIAQSGAVTEEMLSELPAPVRRYLIYTGIVGRPFVGTVHLRQRGRMRLGQGPSELPFTAEEFYSVDPPAFVWDGTIHKGLLPVGRARDMYLDGEGHVLVKVASLFTVVDARGEEVNQGAMTRYLSEMIWFPSAFLGDNVSFETVDDRSVRVTLTDHGRTATGTLYFDGVGRPTGFVTRRYRIAGGRYDLETWSIPITAYGEFEGLVLPVRGKAVWNLAAGDLESIDVTVTQLEYAVTAGGNPPAPPFQETA